MKHYIQLSLMLATGLSLMACSSRPKVEEEASRHYAQGMLTYSLSQSSEWQSKACPSASDKKWQKADWKSVVQMANGCVVKGQWSQVEDLANHLARQDHLAPWGPYYLSLAADARKDYSRALWMIELALKKAPSLGILKYQKGRILWGLEEYSQAMEMFEEALDKEPELLDAHMMLAQIHYRDQEFDKAKDHFEVVLSKDSKNYTALVGLAECELKDGNIDKALGYFDRAVSRNGSDLALRLRQAFVYETVAQNLPEALASFKEIQGLIKRGKLIGSLNFDLSGKIKSLESSLSKLALSEDSSRKPGSEEKVSK